MLSNFRSFICQVVAHGKLKTKENFRLLALNVVAVVYESWSLISDSKYSDLTWNRLVFWKTGRWGEVVAKLEVQLDVNPPPPNSTSTP